MIIRAGRALTDIGMTAVEKHVPRGGNAICKKRQGAEVRNTTATAKVGVTIRGRVTGGRRRIN